MESDPDFTVNTTVKLAEEIPNHIIVSIARLLLPEIQAYYGSSEKKTFFEALETKPKS